MLEKIPVEWNSINKAVSSNLILVLGSICVLGYFQYQTAQQLSSLSERLLTHEAAYGHTGALSFASVNAETIAQNAQNISKIEGELVSVVRSMSQIAKEVAIWPYIDERNTLRELISEIERESARMLNNGNTIPEVFDEQLATARYRLEDVTKEIARIRSSNQ